MAMYTVEEYAEEYGITVEEAQEIFDEEECWKRRADAYDNYEGNDDEPYNGLTLEERNR